MPDTKSSLQRKLKPNDTVERCGFVSKRGRIVEVPNVHEQPDMGFHIDPKTVVEHLKKGAVATWHTHPATSANLSGEDYSLFLAYDDLTHYVISKDEVRAYVVEDGLVVVV